MKPYFCFLIFVLAACSDSRPPVYYELNPEALLQNDFLNAIVKADSFDLELLEWAIFNETNIQRMQLGRPPLKYDARLQTGARLHSIEMVELSYFDHVSPVEKNATVTRRLRNSGIKYGIGGENIAIHPVRKKQEIVFRLAGSGEPDEYFWRNKGSDYTYGNFAYDLVQRWLKSRPHRNNILSRGYGFLGIGAAFTHYEDNDVFFVTQSFATVNY
jgi:uncharacterized protein YkwD